MTKKLSDYSARPVKSPNTEKWVLGATFTMGANGAITATDGDSGVSLADGGVGSFDLTFPACSKVLILVNVISPALTIKSFVLENTSATAGTATIGTLDAAGAAADPANGDKIVVAIIGQPYNN